MHPTLTDHAQAVVASRRRFSLHTPLQPERKSRDGLGWLPLDESADGPFIAWVVDAPDSAAEDTPERVYTTIEEFFNRQPQNVRLLATPASEPEARILLADLVSHIHDRLGTGHYAAGIFLLTTEHGFHLLAIGDCVALVHYLTPGVTYRVSDTTRQASMTCLDLLPESLLCEPAIHLQESIYFGGQAPGCIRPQEVLTLPRRGTARIFLMSDGPERQVGLPTVLQHLRAAAFMTDDNTPHPLQELLRPKEPVDDLTLLAFEIPTPPTAYPRSTESSEQRAVPAMPGQPCPVSEVPARDLLQRRLQNLVISSWLPPGWAFFLLGLGALGSLAFFALRQIPPMASKPATNTRHLDPPKPHQKEREEALPPAPVSPEPPKLVPAEKTEPKESVGANSASPEDGSQTAQDSPLPASQESGTSSTNPR